MTIIQDFLAEINRLLDTYVTNTVMDLAFELSPIVKLALTLMVVFYGVAMMRGTIKAPLGEGIKRIFWVSAVCTVALNASMYNDTITQLFRYDVPGFIQDAVTENTQASSSGPTAPGAALDRIATRGLDAGASLWDVGGFSNLPPLFLGMICWIATIAVVSVGAVLLFVATVGLGILIAIGPLFLVAWLFHATKRFAELWLGQLINFTLIQSLAVTIASFVVSVFEISLDQLQQAAETSHQVEPLDVIKLTLVAVAGTLLLRRVEGFASALSGGITLGFGAVASNLTAPVRAGAGGVFHIAKGATGYGLGRSVRALASPETMLVAPRLQRAAQSLTLWDGRDPTGWGPSWRRGVR